MQVFPFEPVNPSASSGFCFISPRALERLTSPLDDSIFAIKAKRKFKKPIKRPYVRKHYFCLTPIIMSLREASELNLIQDSVQQSGQLVFAD